MYDGLYVKQFILFFGDELRYEIYREDISSEPLKAETFVLSQEIESKRGRYGLMNKIARHTLYNEPYELAEAVKTYQGLDTVTKDLFSVI